MSYTNYIKVHQLIKVHREEKALAMLRDFIAVDPEFGHYYHLLAYLLSNKGDNKAAMDAVNNAIRLTPDKASFVAQKAGFLLHADVVRSLAVIKAAISLDPNDHRSYVTRAHALLRLAKNGEALTAILKAQSLKPDNSDVLNLKYHILIAVGSVEEARETLLQSLEIDASNSIALELLGRHDLDRNDIKRTQYLFKSALQNNPNSERAQMGLKESVYRSDGWYNKISNYRLKLLNLRSFTYVFAIVGLVIIYIAYQSNYLFSDIGSLKTALFMVLIFALFHVRWLSPLLLLISGNDEKMKAFHSTTDKKVSTPIKVFAIIAASCFLLGTFFSLFFNSFAFHSLITVLFTSSLCCMYAILMLDHYRSEQVVLWEWTMICSFWTLFILADLYICMTTANFVNIGFILNLIFVVGYFTLKGVATKQDSR
jgi:Tfp pilus assembly protein PilF